MGDTIKYTHRYLARIVIEADTPLAVGSGQRNVLTDHLVATDVNGLPYIPGTALAGVLRNTFSSTVSKPTLINLFGYSEKDVREENKDKKEKEKDKGQGSRLVLSSAQMVGKDGRVIDGLQEIDFNDPFYAHFRNLPIRQHVRISHRGTAEDGGKFDEQVVYKGTRFCFEMELIGTKADEKDWEQLLQQFSDPAFRIGGGTRKGFGAIKVKELKSQILDLTDEKNLNDYLNKTSELNHPFWNEVNDDPNKFDKDDSGWAKYELKLTPEDFFLFGSGFGNEDGSADMSYVSEKVIEWTDNIGTFTEEKVLIPASSVKGAVAHRTAFHFNKDNEVYADKINTPDFCSTLLGKGYWIPDECKNFDSNKNEDILKMIVEGNPAVRELFGYSANDETGQRGKVIFSDVHLQKPAREKLLNHVAIDRFTGGAIDGALFSEEVVGSKEEFSLEILVKTDVDEKYVKAFEKALNDLCTGMLPLGGGTMRGHGCFTGTCKPNLEEKQ